MARLPQPGSDVGTWGDILNDYLSQSHKPDGTLKDSSVTSAALAPGSVTVGDIADSTISEAKLDAAVQAKLNSGGTAGVTSVNTRTGAVTLTKSDVGLANVDNTTDASKPVSTATQTALNAKADTASLATVATTGDYADLINKPTIPSGTVADGSLTPVKLASDTPVGGELLSYNGTGFEWITAPAGGGGGETNTASNIGTGGVGVYKQKTGVNIELKSVRAGSTKLSVTDNTSNNTVDLDVVPANLGLTKSDVGLANVDNTSDASKPVSTATQTALDNKANTIHTHNSITMTMAAENSPTPLVINQPNVTTVSSSELMQINLEGTKTAWFNEWGAPRVRIPASKNGDSVFKGMYSTSYTGVPFQLIREGGASTYSFAVHADGSFSMADTSAPSAPPTNMKRVYPKADGKLYVKDAAGTESTVAYTSDITTSLAAKRDLKNQAEVTLQSGTDYIERFTIVNDGSAGSTWPNRREIRCTPVGGGTPRLVQYENEYGEKRINARQNTVAWRAFVREYAADAAHDMTVPIWEIQDDRDARTPLHRMFGNGNFLHTGAGTVGGTLAVTGNVTAPNIGEKVVTWPTGSEPSLSGVPDGTLWIEYTP